MKATVLLAAAAMLAAFAAHAPAQTPATPAPVAPAAPAATPGPGPATPEQIAAARAEADQLIAAAGAQAYFVNLTAGILPRVRHLASGMECSFTPGERLNEIRLYPSAAPDEDVSCQTFDPFKSGGGAINTLYASRAPQSRTLAQAMNGMTQALRQRFADAKSDGGKYASVALSDRQGRTAPVHAVARYKVSHPGEPGLFFERVAAGAAGGWIVSQRISAPLDKAQIADLEGEFTLTLALLQVQATAAPESPGRP